MGCRIRGGLDAVLRCLDRSLNPATAHVPVFAWRLLVGRSQKTTTQKLLPPLQASPEVTQNESPSFISHGGASPLDLEGCLGYIYSRSLHLSRSSFSLTDRYESWILEAFLPEALPFLEAYEFLESSGSRLWRRLFLDVVKVPIGRRWKGI